MEKKNYRLSRPCIDLLMDLQASESKKAKRHLTYGTVIERAVEGLIEDGPIDDIDWLFIAEKEDRDYSEIESVSSRQATSPIGITLRQSTCDAIDQIKDFSERNFDSLKRPGGVYVGVAIRYLLLAYRRLEEGKPVYRLDANRSCREDICEASELGDEND